MTKNIVFELDGQQVEAAAGETIWQVAKRLGTTIPHLCWQPLPGYRADGNCRACMVEIEGERVLAASCQRKVSDGLKVKTASARAKKSRAMVFELLAADQPARDDTHDPRAIFWRWVEDMEIAQSGRFSNSPRPAADATHTAISVNLDACIHCGLCVRACRDVQMNDVIGMSGRGAAARITFDFDVGLGDSTCVACGECVQVCPTGALLESGLLEIEVPVADRAGADKSINSLCPYCGVGCQTEVHVKDEKIIAVDGRNGPANQNRLCVKGRFGFDYIHHADRLTKPLIRRDDVDKSSFTTGSREDISKIFREASWEEALLKVTASLKRIRDDHGANACAGLGSAKCSNEEAYLFQKFIRQGLGTNNVDHCTRLCHASSVAALMEGLNSGAVTAPFTAAADADCIIVIGARPAENHPVAATFIKNAVRDGAKLIVMDPRGQASGISRFADHVVAFKPGMDVALLNAMIHVIIEEDLVDRQYIQANTEGFDDLKAKVADFSPNDMADICGIRADAIRTVARLYARSERSLIFWGMGISQHTHGTDNARCLIALALITGHIGRRGTGMHPLRGQNNVQGASDAGLIPMFYPNYKSVEDAATRAKFEAAWNVTLDPASGLTVVEMMKAMSAGSIRAMYIMGENPAMSDPDLAHARKALCSLDFLVVQDIFLTQTAWQADVVLPASAHAEKLGSYTNTNRQVQIGRQVVAPPGEARHDWRIILDIAQGLGLDWQYGDVGDVYAEMASVMSSLNNISWQRLLAEDCVTYPCDAPDQPGQEILFGAGFPTKSGRAKIVPADLLAPAEVPDDDYPLVLTTGRLLEHWHTGSMTRRAAHLDALEPDAIASMHPRQMDQLSFAAGDTIRVTTRRGTIEIKLRADRDVAQGMISIPFCFAESPANILTNPQLDPIGKIPEFKFCAARVEAVVSQTPAPDEAVP